jgi:F-type H+-transporting ATPase subunit b
MFALDGQTIVQIIAQIINVSLLAFVLANILYQPVRKFLAARSGRIADQLEQAAADKAQAAELKQQYEQMLKDAGRKCDELIEESRKNAAETARRMVADARHETDALKARVDAEVKMEWERARADMKRAIVEVSAAMTAKFIALSIDDKTSDRLFDEAMSELRGVPWQS